MLISKLIALIKLSRWRQHVPYTIPLVLLGGLMSSQHAGVTIDWRLFPVTVANVLAMVFAFMINDVIDAPDDARNPVKTASNVISQGIVSVREAGIVSVVVFLLSAGLFAYGGVWVLFTGITTLILSALYSVPPIRLKARPIVDVLSHVLMLSALLVISGYVIYDTTFSAAWWVILGVTFASAYGQFYNQLDDFDTDEQANLKNTALWIGRDNSVRLMVLCAILTIICFIVAIAFGVFPQWLGWVLLVTVFTLGLFQWDIDMRGNTTDTSGMVQRPVLITANMIAFIWLLSELGLLGIG